MPEGLLVCFPGFKLIIWYRRHKSIVFLAHNLDKEESHTWPSHGKTQHHFLSCNPSNPPLVLDQRTQICVELSLPLCLSSGSLHTPWSILEYTLSYQVSSTANKLRGTTLVHVYHCTLKHIFGTIVKICILSVFPVEVQTIYISLHFCWPIFCHSSIVF